MIKTINLTIAIVMQGIIEAIRAGFQAARVNDELKKWARFLIIEEHYTNDHQSKD